MRSKHHEACRVRLAIGDLVRAAAPAGWTGATVRCAQVGRFSLITVDCDGVEIGVQGLAEPFHRLRELSHRDGEGSWFSCELRFTPESRAYRGQVDADGFPFPEGMDIPDIASLEELTVFPRDAVPGWLLDALPTAVPVGLREPEDPWQQLHRRSRPPVPEPVIAGELAYTPIGHLAAHGFEFRGDLGGPTVLLTEKAGGGGDYLLFIARSRKGDPRYWVTREDMRGAGGGITACVLDERRLVLHLTPEAADAMETETVLSVDLHLEADEMERLRTVLGGILRIGGPELTPSLTGL